MIDTFLMVVFNFARSGVSLNLPIVLPLDEAKLFSSFRPFGLSVLLAGSNVAKLVSFLQKFALIIAEHDIFLNYRM